MIISHEEFELPKEFAEQWIKALRSGEYAQCDSVLYSGETDQYCCLGVACRIVNVDTVILNQVELPYMLGTHVPKALPEALHGHGHMLSEYLAGLNDDGATFEEIADWIEKHVKFV